MNGAVSGKRVIVGVTGASGALYATRLVRALIDGGAEVHFVVTPHGQRLLWDELAIRGTDAVSILGRSSDRFVVHSYRDVGSVLGSGSFYTDGMIVCPCSSSRMAAIAAGLGDNLLGRAAAVTLKESRRLILVPREMPMGRVDLLNALRASECGAIICPASPGFYMKPRTVEDLVDFVVGKLLDLVGVPHSLNTRWQTQLAREPDDPPNHGRPQSAV